MIKPEDLLVENSPNRERKGGQHAGITFGIKLTHIPTGLVAIVESERSQHRNRAVALDMILGGLTSPNFGC